MFRFIGRSRHVYNNYHIIQESFKWGPVKVEILLVFIVVNPIIVDLIRASKELRHFWCLASQLDDMCESPDEQSILNKFYDINSGAK